MERETKKRQRECRNRADERASRRTKRRESLDGPEQNPNSKIARDFAENDSTEKTEPDLADMSLRLQQSILEILEKRAPGKTC